MSVIVWFDDVTAGDTARVGGKGANLGECARAGLPVPPGFTDLDGDGDPDVLRTRLRGYDGLIVDDDDDMTTQDTDRDLDSDLIMVDKNRDGRYDGNVDFYYDALDLDELARLHFSDDRAPVR